MAEEHGVRLLGSFAKPVTARKLAAAVLPYLEGDARLEAAPGADTYPMHELREALANGNIHAWFQPKVEASSGRVVGAEALVRWMSHAGHALLPARFLPQVEREGLMAQLTDIVLDQACAACVRWSAEGLPPSVSVNLSQASLADETFPDRIGAIVERHGLHATNVILEVTESVSTASVATVLENVARLRMRGFGLAVDDFGTGYSSLKQLTRMPFTELKVDQSFVRTAHTRQASRAVLESSVEMAAKLGIPAVAEGVETLAQLELVRELGCRIVQGWLFGRAMPAQDLIAAGPVLAPAR
jgi:EAL domain-containing protein (putative c-di-GMP-specific phosphodiesterase class I)